MEHARVFDLLRAKGAAVHALEQPQIRRGEPRLYGVDVDRVQDMMTVPSSIIDRTGQAKAVTWSPYQKLNHRRGGVVLKRAARLDFSARKDAVMKPNLWLVKPYAEGAKPFGCGLNMKHARRFDATDAGPPIGGFAPYIEHPLPFIVDVKQPSISDHGLPSGFPRPRYGPTPRGAR